MLTLGVLGIRLALGAQTEREGVKLQPSHPQPHPRTCCFPGFPYLSLFIPILSLFFQDFPITASLPKLSADPHPGLLCSRMSCSPIHPHRRLLDETSPGPIATPFRTQAAATRLPWMLFPQSFPSPRMGRSPRAPLAVLGEQHPLSPTSGGCPGGEFGVRGGWLGRAGLARGLGSLLADGHRLRQHLLGQTLEEPGAGAFPHLREQGRTSQAFIPTSTPCSSSR